MWKCIIVAFNYVLRRPCCLGGSVSLSWEEDFLFKVRQENVFSKRCGITERLVSSDSWITEKQRFRRLRSSWPWPQSEAGKGFHWPGICVLFEVSRRQCDSNLGHVMWRNTSYASDALPEEADLSLAEPGARQRTVEAVLLATRGTEIGLSVTWLQSVCFKSVK